MKKIPTYLTMYIVAIAAFAQSTEITTDILRTNVNTVDVTFDGKKLKKGWSVKNNNDEVKHFDTRAHEIVFASDIDTLKITLDTWQTKDFTIMSANGDKTPVKVTRVSENIYEYPDPHLLIRTPDEMLSREQAVFDIKALVYGLSEVHPNIFSVCKQEDFFRAVNNAVETLPDSISTMELYQKTAPIVAMIGDGHTNLIFPYNDFTPDLKRMPLGVDVMNDKSILCHSSLDSIIPRGAIILSINGVNAEDIVNSMLPYVAGEKEHFKISRINSSFSALHYMLYPADSFTIVYLPKNEKTPKTVTYPATIYKEVIRRGQASPKDKKEPYSFTINKEQNVAIMDFREFKSPSKMKIFADSMFRDLRNQNIDNLIIDLRLNGGGNSSVGDVLLRYISREPFVQMDKMLMRITPLTRKLMNADNIDPEFSFFETSDDQLITPRTTQEGHYSGNVYLLTSNKTFSSASSFAWVFKECCIGKVIGEETGGMNVSFGDVLTYRLPVSNLLCSISYKKFWLFRADEKDIHGTIPDIAVPAADALDKALQIIKTKRQSQLESEF